VPTRLALDDFQLDQATIEVRFAPSYFHWDRAGSIWMEATRLWPSLKLHEAKPAQTVFSLDRKQELTASLDQARFLDVAPDRSLEAFGAMASQFLRIVAKALETTHYTRVGLRQMFFKQFEDDRSAADAVLASGRLVPPSKAPFGVGGSPLQPQYVLRWEGDTLGVRADVRAEGRVLDFIPPGHIRQLQPVHVETQGVVYDVDLYTVVASVGIDQLDVREWVRNAVHVLRRDTDEFLRA
jgi:hypothetical protein